MLRERHLIAVNLRIDDRPEWSDVPPVVTMDGVRIPGVSRAHLTYEEPPATFDAFRPSNKLYPSPRHATLMLRLAIDSDPIWTAECLDMTGRDDPIGELIDAAREAVATGLPSLRKSRLAAAVEALT